VGTKPSDEKVSEGDLRNWRVLEEFRTCLHQSFGQSGQHPSFSDPRRLLTASNYLSLFLFGLFNPVVRTMRGLCQISQLNRVQSEVCEHRVSLGSFSEAQHLLDGQLLERVFAQLSQSLPADKKDARLGQWQWLARDGSLFAALPRMHWALYGAGKAGAPNKAVRLHLSLNVLEDKPKVAAVRVGKECERAVWRQQWKAGEAYIGDRYFAENHSIFGELAAKGCAYVLRLREQSTINIEQELPITPADQKAGVLRQAWATLGCRKRNRSVRLRLVWVQTSAGNTLILATNLSPEQLPAELVWLLYRKRWQIELFFRWIKCILESNHWLAESQCGVTLQMYLSLIAALLIQLYTERKPSKRLMELIQLHQLGYATTAELQAGLEQEKARLARKKT
jgi:hypothetical protein